MSSKILGFICCWVLTVGLNSAEAQTAVQFEKAGSYNTIKFFEGERLIYKIKSDRQHWLDETIERIYVDQGLIQFENRAVFVDSIYAIRIGSSSGFVRGASAGLVTFSYAWGFWTLVSLAFGDPLSISTIVIGAGSFLVGKLMQLTFVRTHKLGRRKRLKLIDLTFHNELIHSSGPRK